MKAVKLLIAIFILIISTTVCRAQQTADTTQKKTEVSAPTGKKAKEKKKETVNNGETSVTGKKIKPKKKEKEEPPAVKLDSTSTRADSINAALPPALRKAKSGKAAAQKPAPKKAVKPEEPPAEPKIIPGAEAKANADTKDKEDRTMKGPSGQKVYSSSKGGKYYFDVNGNKKFLKRDIQK